MFNFSMRIRWRLTLCLWGLVLFGLFTYASVQGNRELRHVLSSKRLTPFLNAISKRWAE